ncbi:MAG TPA: hypothetical protein VN697_03380 [Tepidiformaceae bacterium]|nr:hypothetical protein [Tepidiformaceae bacterium]
MITWGQLALGIGLFLPIAGLILAVGRLLERIDALRTDVTSLRTTTSASAIAQGRRIGNLESYVGLTADGIPVERMGDFSGRVRGSNDR